MTLFKTLKTYKTLNVWYVFTRDKSSYKAIKHDKQFEHMYKYTVYKIHSF